MPDICKCEGNNCPIKNTCYRYMAKCSQYGQAYFEPPPVVDGKCKYYMSTEGWENYIDESKLNNCD